ncbi:MAG: endolytic transglycosylase MltG [Dehalococcoidia bacterium]|nr:endolytic transglycosylase MltG [Dehalococcoidia bacterium]
MVSARLLFAAGALIALGLTAAAVWLIVESPGSIDEVAPYAAPAPGGPGSPVPVTVAGGQGPEQIGRLLQDSGVIQSAEQFEVLVSLMGYDRLLQAGEYEFQTGTPALQVVYRMRRGVLSPRSVTVVEGWRLEEIADAVAAQGVDREAFLAAAESRDYDFDFVKELPRGQSLEGFLYPATYPIRSSDKPADLVRRMLQAFDERVPAGLRDSGANLGLSLSDMVTLASIIEREARLPEERPVMAQVFLRRLRLGIPLEADPTVQYALGSEARNVRQFGYWKQGLTAADLQTDSLYNTYQYYGVPPGPICSPGLDSIIAVAQPADTDYLYFVAKPDGSHAFAETLEEHIENVRKYGGGGE